MLARLIAGLVLLFCLIPAAHADELRPGYLELTQSSPSQWRMVWKAPIRGGLAANGDPVLPEVCKRSDERRELVAGALVSVWNVTCPQGLVGKRIGLTGLDMGFTDALVRIAPSGRPVQAARLTSDSPMVLVKARPDRTDVARTYFKLGVEHILFGFDHLLFVVALVLLLRGGWIVAKTVTAFTVAHSLTLIGTTLGFVRMPQPPVEAVIALSIIFLAVEIVKRREGSPRLSERFPWIVAFLFGLLHGFGFAGALAEIGMPEGEVPMALFTFNVGVEVGQLLIVGMAIGVLSLARRFLTHRVRQLQVASAYAIGTTASYWFIDRMIF